MSKGIRYLFGWTLFLTVSVLIASGPVQSQSITINGTVRESGSNTPIASLLVRAMEVNFGFKCSTGGGSPYTNASGQYALVCPPGKYKVLFGPTATHVSQWYNNSPTYAGGSWVGAASGSVSSVDAWLVATGGGQITGQVTDPYGIPIQDIRVYAYDESFYCPDLLGSYYNQGRPQMEWFYQMDWMFPYCEDAVTSAQTNAAGSYAISNLAPGKYKLFFYVYASNHLAEWWNDRQSFAQANLVTVTSGGTTTANAQLAMGGRISGTIRDGAGHPLPNAGIGAYTDKQLWVRGASSLANGTYEVDRLPSGEYKVIFSGPTGTDWAYEWYDNRRYVAEAQSVKVYAGQNHSGIDAQLETGWSIQGTVNPDLYSARVTAYDLEKNKVGYGLSDQSGHYIIRGLPNGAYKIRFEKEGYGFQWYNSRRTWETAQEVAIQGGGVGGINAALDLDAQLEGNLSSASDYAPIPEVKVKVYDDAAEQLIIATVTNSWGDYFVKRIPSTLSGTYGKLHYDALGTCFQPEWWYDRPGFAAANPVYFQSNGITYMIDYLEPGGCVFLPLVLRQ